MNSRGWQNIRGEWGFFSRGQVVAEAIPHTVFEWTKKPEDYLQKNVLQQKAVTSLVLKKSYEHFSVLGA